MSNKGRITVVSYVVNCGICENKEALATGRLPERTAMGLGWCWYKVTGWICPLHTVMPQPDGVSVDGQLITEAS